MSTDHGLSLIVVSPEFDGVWPFSADHLNALWSAEGTTEFLRLAPDDSFSLVEFLVDLPTVSRLAALGFRISPECIERMPGLKEAFLDGTANEAKSGLAAAGVAIHTLQSEGYWGQSVAEFALALTLCGLRRIPQLHHEILSQQAPWDYSAKEFGRPGQRGLQFGDDDNFANGTIEGKRVRVVGAGNIGSRYARFTHAIGADVAAWDPYAAEPAFHLAGSRRVASIDALVVDAEIFAPMLPLTERTRGIVTERHIDMLPKGALVVLATRADICDMRAVRRRVQAGELSLAADVFDIEPLPLDDPLLGRGNVVHTPHIAGRTHDANNRYAEAIAATFE